MSSSAKLPAEVSATIDSLSAPRLQAVLQSVRERMKELGPAPRSGTSAYVDIGRWVEELSDRAVLLELADVARERLRQAQITELLRRAGLS